MQNSEQRGHSPFPNVDEVFKEVSKPPLLVAGIDIAEASRLQLLVEQTIRTQAPALEIRAKAVLGGSTTRNKRGPVEQGGVRAKRRNVDETLGVQEQDLSDRENFDEEFEALHRDTEVDGVVDPEPDREDDDDENDYNATYGSEDEGADDVVESTF